jgi:hypothetical protein
LTLAPFAKGVVVEGGTALVAAGAAARASVMLAAETGRVAVRGTATSTDVTDKFYGSHFGDIYGWAKGHYARQGQGDRR